MEFGVVAGALGTIAGVVLVAVSIPMKRSLKARMRDQLPVEARIIEAYMQGAGEHTSLWWKVSREGMSESRTIAVGDAAYDAHEIGDRIEVFVHPDTGRLMLDKRHAGGAYARARGWGVVLLVLGFFAFGMSGALD